MLEFNYEGERLRGVVDDDGAWFVAVDVAVALGYRDSPNMLRKFDEREIRWFTLQGRRGEYEARAVSAAALVGLSFKSRSKKAEGLRRWLLDEILTVALRPGVKERARVRT